MIEIGLLRHGEVMGGTCFRGSTDDPLTDIGLNQMRKAAQGYPDRADMWNQIISSPLQRCARFAEEFSQQHSLPLRFDDRLQEMHFGDWEGRTAAELIDEDPEPLTQFWADPFNRPPPRGEQLSHFQSRVLKAWSNVIQRHINQRVLLVTHGGVIRILLCHLQQRPVSALLEIEIEHGTLYTFHNSDDVNDVTAFQPGFKF